MVEVLLSTPQLELVTRESSGMMALLREGRLEDLRRMHELFTMEGVRLQVSCLALFCQSLSPFLN